MCIFIKNYFRETNVTILVKFLVGQTAHGHTVVFHHFFMGKKGKCKIGFSKDKLNFYIHFEPHKFVVLPPIVAQKV